jgi:hypothetical protein
VLSQRSLSRRLVRGVAALVTASAVVLVQSIAAQPATAVTLSTSVTHSDGLDPAALQRAIEIQPGDHAAGLIARVQQGTQVWRG